MSQLSKCPILRVVLGYWEALGEVSELRYKNLLYSISQRSYCTFIQDIKDEKLNKIPDKKQTFDAESCLQCRDSDSREYGEPRVNIGLMKKRTNSDCRFWADLRRR